jgi:hypothetical protein
MSLEAIGRAAGRHPSTVGYWLTKHGLEAVGRDRHAAKERVGRDVLEALVAEGLTIEGIALRLGVADTTARNWLKKNGLRTHRGQRRNALDESRRSGSRDVEARCSTHGLTRHVVIASERRLRCAKCRSQAVSRRRRKVKEILISEAGGNCILCGYDRNAAALHFHHLDPKTKSFSLGVRGITRSLEKLRAEARKCVLLCANCHAEVEVGAVQLSVKSVPPMRDPK